MCMIVLFNKVLKLPSTTWFDPPLRQTKDVKTEVLLLCLALSIYEIEIDWPARSQFLIGKLYSSCNNHILEDMHVPRITTAVIHTEWKTLQPFSVASRFPVASKEEKNFL